MRRRPSPTVAGLIASGLIAASAIAAFIFVSLLDKFFALVFETYTGQAIFDVFQRGILGLGEHAAEKIFAATIFIMMVAIFFSVRRTDS